MQVQISGQISGVRNAILTVDRNGLLWITEFRHPILNRFMEIYSRLGDWDVWTGAVGALLIAPSVEQRAFGRRHSSTNANEALRSIGFAILPRILGTLAACFTLKRIARRSRPSLSVEGFSTLLSDPDPYSFPSSHAACSWAACIAAARGLGGIGWFLTFHAVLISYSRVHVGAHYPLDVLTGAGIGIAAGML